MTRKLTRYLRQILPGQTPQHRPMRPDQVPNSAGGYAWEVDPWTLLDRFLILGTEGGTFYVSERSLTVENARTVVKLIDQDGLRVVERTAEVSEQGRAYRNDAALFVLALAFALGDEDTRRAAREALPRVARIGTHLFTFLDTVGEMRGWGRGLRRAVADWYGARTPRELAYQGTKYARRGGWSHRDALRLAHPRADGPERDALYRYLTGNGDKLAELEGDLAWRDYLAAVEAVRTETRPERAAELVRQYELPREVIPTELLREALVWEALLERMPMTATIRNLATMTRVGLLAPLSAAADRIAERVTDAAALERARIHPIQVLAALITYQAGRGARGKGSWVPVQSVVDALDMAFYLSFDNVEATGKRVMLALDVSGSMGWGTVAGVPGLSPRTAAAALALVTAATEPNAVITAFSHQMVPLGISPRQRLDDVIERTSSLPFGGTDCALPMRYAQEKGLDIDAFVVLTDSETWFGDMHPAEALAGYRRHSGIPAKLAVVGMLANRFSIADPNDVGMLDVVGFSTDVPSVLADFIRG